MMMSTRHLSKEVCECCHKQINIGQAITECLLCMIIIHTKCFKQSNIKLVNNNYYCSNCATHVDVRYDPFLNTYCDNNTASDTTHYYDEELTDTSEILRQSSDILQNCLGLDTITDLNTLLNSNPELTHSCFSSLFFNLDGNKSNFDTFAVELERHDHTFSVIGLAETNTMSSQKNLFQLNDYNSYYQDCYPGKNKGSGVALYIHKTLNIVPCSDLSQTSPNLESLFVTITNHSTPLTVGVIYRPPNGNRTDFLFEFKHILEQAPRNNTYILGDFNMDLHNICYAHEKEYEELVITSGFIPTISLYTHNKPDCRKTCIDNILVNNPEKISISGTIKESMSHSHHLPIFQVTKLLCDEADCNPTTDTQYYDFCNSNIAQFVTNLDDTIKNTNTDNIDFSDFSYIYTSVLDNTCKLKVPKVTKRNRKCNPWITDGIIASVKTKSFLYKD